MGDRLQWHEDTLIPSEEVPGVSTARDWQTTKAQWISILEERTGERLEVWKERIEAEGFTDELRLRQWLTDRGVTGYAQSVLVMERFGYPDFFVAGADELVDAQYADRQHLRPIYDALIEAALGLGEVVVQARKTYVSLVGPRRTFARIQPTTKRRVDLGLRLDGYEPDGRLEPSRIHETMKVQISLTSPDQVDAEVLEWLERAYTLNL